MFRILSGILNLFFVLAFPLVIVGFFSSQNLNPIKTSIIKFFNHLAMFKFVLVLLLVQYGIRWLLRMIIPEGFTYYSKILLLALLTEPLSFIVLVYSFLLITDYFMKDLQFNLEK